MKLLDKYCLFFLTLITTLFAGTVFAVDDITEFQMDGDALEATSPPPPFADVFGDDWDTLWHNGANDGGDPLVFTGVRHDHDPDDVFDGGKKDIQDISEWSWKLGTPLDKGNITHAYATAYMCPELGVPEGCSGDSCECENGDVIAYFGADRASNKGDTFMGFWFFKQDVLALPDGTFTNQHEYGDTLVLVNFPQSVNAVPEIRVVKWNTACTKAVKNPVTGDCAAENLELVYEGVVCHSELSDDACAITNTQELFPNGASAMFAGTVSAPWDYVSKNPDVNCDGPYCFPYETFFEGGINLTKLVGMGEDTCYATFMAETRSSSEFTATLKDFSLDQFPLCSLELSKTCGTGVFNPDTGYLEIPYSVTVRNTGGATVDQVDALDDVCGTAIPDDPATTEVDESTYEAITFTNVLVDSSQTFNEGLCQFAPGSFIPPVENGVWASASDGTAVVLATSCTTDDGYPGWCFDSCDFNLSPTLAVSKDCVTRLTDENGSVEVKVIYGGVVTNTSDVPQCDIPFGETEGTCVFPVGAVCTESGDCETAPTLLTDVQVEDDNGIADNHVPLTLYNEALIYPVDPDHPQVSRYALVPPVILGPGESAFFDASYMPAYLNAECPSAAVFSDVVTATAVDAYTMDSVGPEYAPADCTLCDSENCN